MKLSAVVFLSLMAITVLPDIASAQDEPRIGVTMGYPSAVGILWRAGERIALRPEFTWAMASTESSSTDPIVGSSLTSTPSTNWQTGVGLSALLGSLAVGAGRIVAVDTSPAKLELARTLGATDVFDATDPSCAAAIVDALDGGVEFAFEMAGAAAAVELACEVTRRGGTTVTAGLAKPNERLSMTR